MNILNDIAVCVRPLVDPPVLQEVNKRVVHKSPLNAPEVRSACELLHYQESFWLVPSEYVEYLTGLRATLPPVAYLLDKSNTVAKTLMCWGLLEYDKSSENKIPELYKTFKSLSIISIKRDDPRVQQIRHYDYTNLMTILNYKIDAGDLC